MRGYFDFCGFYLGPAPSHPNDGWMGQHSFLSQLGYRFLPIYVGQEVVGPGSHNDTQAQGTKDGNDATALAAKAGFAKGSPVYLDLENGAPFPPKEGAYTLSWIAQVLANGYRPGIYCSHVLATHFDSTTTLVWAFEVPTTREMVVTLPLPVPYAPPQIVPWTALQYRQNIRLAQLKLTVDLNATPDAHGLAS